MKTCLLLLLVIAGCCAVHRGVPKRCVFACFMVYTPVCGDDGVTYVNRCSMEWQACVERKTIEIQHHGPCDDS
ncbi:hypothetical protein SNE40_003981 [Patella caerulea]|uniref:Kazal-like domain-containing protein n=1 Tax=Patella caerulea TaxID=87958 RepID=A0AAN8QG28_PATCE